MRLRAASARRPPVEGRSHTLSEFESNWCGSWWCLLSSWWCLVIGRLSPGESGHCAATCVQSERLHAQSTPWLQPRRSAITPHFPCQVSSTSTTRRRLLSFPPHKLCQCTASVAPMGTAQPGPAIPVVPAVLHQLQLDLSRSKFTSYTKSYIACKFTAAGI